MKHEIKIAFLGTFGEFSKIYLDALKKAGFEIVLGITDKNIDFKKIELDLKNNPPDIGVIAYFGKIIPKELLQIPKKGFLNAHPSLLPRWRGPSPIQAAILAGDKSTGVTIHLAAEKADSGDILAQKEVPIGLKDTCLSLTELLAKEGAELLVETIKKWLTGEIKPRKQDDSQAIYTKILKKSDGKIDWSRDAEHIERMVRAYNPWPSAYTAGIKILKAEVITNKTNLAPGTLFETDGWPAIACGNGALKLLIVQPEGKKEMPGDAYLRGHRNLIGEVLE